MCEMTLGMLMSFRMHVKMETCSLEETHEECVPSFSGRFRPTIWPVALKMAESCQGQREMWLLNLFRGLLIVLTARR